MDQEIRTAQEQEVLDVLCSAHSFGPSGPLSRQDAEYALKALHDAGYRVINVSPRRPIATDRAPADTD
jgi:predicted CoA-binding protein